MQQTFTGHCLCGAVSYQLDGEIKKFYHCHCERCRRATGTGHATNMMILPASPEKIRWVKGEDLITRFKVPEAERFTNSFCKLCGGRVPRYAADMDMVVIPAGSLDSDPVTLPQARIFWDSRVNWACDAGDLPVYSEYPPNT